MVAGFIPADPQDAHLLLPCTFSTWLGCQVPSRPLQAGATLGRRQEGHVAVATPILGHPIHSPTTTWGNRRHSSRGMGGSGDRVLSLLCVSAKFTLKPTQQSHLIPLLRGTSSLRTPPPPHPRRAAGIPHLQRRSLLGVGGIVLDLHSSIME